MCTYFDKVVDGINVFSVGKQQLWDWCSYNGREFTGWLPEHTSVLSYADSLRKGIYLVVELPAAFGRVLKPQLIASCTSLKSAVSLALTYDEYRLHRACPSGCAYGCDYEVWHVVDDAELWLAWDHNAKMHRIDVIYEIDRDTHSFRGSFSSLAVDYLYRFYAPAYGFLLCKRTFFIDSDFFSADGCMVESILLDDFDPAVSFDDIYSRPDCFVWFDSWDLAHLDEPFSAVMYKHYCKRAVVDALEQMRYSLELDCFGLYVGGDVGETC